jgi:hypothetical protein
MPSPPPVSGRSRTSKSTTPNSLLVLRAAEDAADRRSMCRVVMVSRPVSGILWAPSLAARRPVAIHLCGLPEGCPATCVVGRTGRPFPLLGLAPGGVYRAARVAPNAGALLPHRFTLTCDRSPGPSAVCSLLHLSVRSPRPGSRQHPARWSPDFPRPVAVADSVPRPPDRLTIARRSVRRDARHCPGQQLWSA